MKMTVTSLKKCIPTTFKLIYFCPEQYLISPVNILYSGFIQVFWEGAFFAKETGHLGIKIAGVSCKIWELCMILKKLQLRMGPVSGPCETQDKALVSEI